MRKHFIIAFVLFLSVSLSACTKAETPTETSSVLATQETEVIEETSTQITTSEPSTIEKPTTSITISNEEKEDNVSTTATTLPKIIELKTTPKLNPTEDKTIIKNVPEPTKPVEETTVQTT